jgi:hypothetical protein
MMQRASVAEAPAVKSGDTESGHVGGVWVGVYSESYTREEEEEEEEEEF